MIRHFPYFGSMKSCFAWLMMVLLLTAMIGTSLHSPEHGAHQTIAQHDADDSHHNTSSDDDCALCDFWQSAHSMHLFDTPPDDPIHAVLSQRASPTESALVSSPDHVAHGSRAPPALA